VVILFSVLAALLWASAMANRFTRPLAQLAAGARAISGGDYDTVLPTRGYEETEQLAASFRDMITAVREREQRYAALAESLPVGVFRTDAQGRCFWVNRAWEEISGLSLEQARGEGWSMALHPEDRHLMLAAWARHVHGEGSLFCECRFLRPNGEVRWIHARAVEELSKGGEITSHVGTITDITQRKQAEEELVESEKRFRGLVANLPGVVYRCANDANWTIQYISDSIRDLTGYPASDFIRNRVRSFSSVIHPDDREAVSEHVAGSVDRGDAYVLEYRIIDSTGEIHWVYERGRGVFFEDGKFHCLDGVIFDTTERKLALAEKSKLEEQLRQSQKMEAIGQLAGGVAHDFNNLLLAILGNIEFVLDDLPHDAPVRDDLFQVKRAAEKAADLTRQLLAFSRRQMIQPVDLDLNEVITDLIKLLRRVIGGNIALEIVPGHGLHSVRADRGQIEQVLMNLVVNSRDAMPDGGRIVIKTANHDLTEEECEGHDWAEVGPHVLLSVTDTGEGMDEATIAHIFEPFFTTKDVGKGTGLGLATVYGIIRQHSGVIKVSSQAGVGTTFKILLPKSGISAESDQEIFIADLTEGGETILYVEDDENVRKVGVRSLEGAGYRVLEAENGAEAVRLFREHARTIDLVILDQLMPVMGGVEAQREIARIRPGIRFIQCTGHAMETAPAPHSGEHGEVPIIRKPYSRREFLKIVRDTLDR
jgi:PAS domain S-box-containing protein